MLDSVLLKNKLKDFLRQNASKKKVIVINSHNRIEIIKEAIKSSLKYFDADTKILCFKSAIPEEFTNFADRVVLSEDYLAYEDCVRIDDYVFGDVSKNWDKEMLDKFRGVFTYRNVELARIAEYDFQIFLLARIKAIAVLGVAMKREDYKAAFIIDSNSELGGFDKFLNKHYGILSELIKIDEGLSLSGIIRRKIASLVSTLIDCFASILTGRKKESIIDARLFYQLDRGNQDIFILAPFEKGVRLRLKCLIKNGGYIAFKLNHEPHDECWSRRSRFNLSKRPLSIRNKFIFEGVNYWELIEPRINTLLQHDFARFRRNIDILYNMHRRNKLRSIMLRNDVKELEKTVILFSKTLNISTIVVQHGILAEPNGHNVIFADKVAVWGNRSSKWYERFGNNLNKVKVVGNPNFDSLLSYMKSKGDKDLRDRLGLGRKQHLIALIAPGTGKLKLSSFVTDDGIETLAREVIKAVKAIGDTNLVIKLHPNDNVKTFARLISREDRDSICVVKTINLRELIKTSDLVITKDSSVGLEALLMKKPLVVVNLSKRPDLVPYVESGVAIGAYKTEEIEKAVRRAVSNEDAKLRMDLSREEFINDYLYKIDGRAKERILELV